MRLDQVVVRREAILDLEHDSVHVEGLDPGSTASSMAAGSGRRQLHFRKTYFHESPVVSTGGSGADELLLCVGDHRKRKSRTRGRTGDKTGAALGGPWTNPAEAAC